ncbi:efflux RND transporter permease subunit [Desulfobulbus alkaliphilus]|uniref:efflux RND transporter permease subunit n=1 Tax=Desulfobulbus alkaliphilus TaxID=869814 RepID=UPI00196529CB|nr:efflux RND transporter permease subunit [Desulfobulbus alkaliphilus]MBM9536515.1 efflux RND transporter permease subunit [Desulfobulbus alkaliphilus]
MLLSDLSVKRPVFASVISLLLVAFGLVSFDRLALREYPRIDPPVVTIDVRYPGASASIVETRITQLVENRISGIEGINYIQSSSEDGRSRVILEFNINRDIDAAANDVRDRVAGLLNNLPDEASPPEVQKVNSDDDVVVWYSLSSPYMNGQELTDYARRYLAERFSVLDGVANVRIGGSQTYAMRIWLDRNAMAARGLTVSDIENALRAENIELPAGEIESIERQFTVRVERTFRTVEDFARLVLAKGQDGHLVRLSDVARVERGTVENRTMFRGDGLPRIGIGITRQSVANTLQVTDAAARLVEELNPTLPDGMVISRTFDSSVFIKAAIREVYVTLAIALTMVVVIIYLFLGNIRATLIPAVTVPVSLIATFSIIYAFGFSINLLTLLALVLAIGIVVDDAIIILENIIRRMQDYRETPLVAAYRGTREVGFAVIATTMVLISVFVPITFLQGDLGRLFTEFALTMAAAILFSSLTALSLSAMLGGHFLQQKNHGGTPGPTIMHRHFKVIRHGYMRALSICIRRPVIVLVVFAALIATTLHVFRQIPFEYTPREDRGVFIVLVNGPEGATFAVMEEYMDEIERRLLTYTGDNGEISSMLVRAPRGFGNIARFNTGMAMVVLEDWGKRRPASVIMNEIRGRLNDLPDVQVAVVMRQGFTRSAAKPVQFVIGGGTYEQLASWRDILIEKIEKNNPGLIAVDWDYKETKPQLGVRIDYDRAAEAGVTVTTIGRTLETMMGSRRVTTYIDDGEEYDVILEGEREEQRSKTSMEHIYVRSSRTGALLPLANFITIEEFADSATLNRYNRVRAITIEANLVDTLPLGEALNYLENLVREHLPDTVRIDYKGESRDLKKSIGSMVFVFVLGIVVVFLVLSAQFESYLHPLVIILTVPLAMAGGLLGLHLTGKTLNIYSQIGLLTLIGLSAKNGILIVEFANQLRDRGASFNRALMKSAQLRLRPILMTGLTAAAGATPLILTSGAGAETRHVIGIVVFVGVLTATLFTIFVVPVAYSLISRYSGSPGDVAKRLQQEQHQVPKASLPHIDKPPTK